MKVVRASTDSGSDPFTAGLEYTIGWGSVVPETWRGQAQTPHCYERLATMDAHDGC